MSTNIHNNVQLYFHNSDETVKKITSKVKKDIFLAGLSLKCNSIDTFKNFIVENGVFNITKVEGFNITFSDGNTNEGIFELSIDDTFSPTSNRPVFCLYSTRDIASFNGEIVTIHYMFKLDRIPALQTGQVSRNNGQGLLQAIKTLIALYNRTAEKVLDDIGDADLGAIEYLENYLRKE